MTKTLTKILMILTCFANLTACSSEIKTVTIRWREEVKLLHGEIVIASQGEEYRPEEVSQTYGLLAKYWISVPLPGTNLSPVSWEGYAKPLAIDVAHNGSIYLVCELTTQQGRRYYSVPYAAEYVAFKIIGTTSWEQVPVGSVPPEIMLNLFIDTNKLFKNAAYIAQGYTTSKIIDLKLKNKIDSAPGIVNSFRAWRHN